MQPAMSLEDFPGWGGGGGGEKLGIRLNSAQLELEAWAELGKNGTYSIFSFSLFLVQKRLLKGKQKWKWKICKWYGCILLVPYSNLRIVKQFTMIANVWQWVIVLHFTELWTVSIISARFHKVKYNNYYDNYCTSLHETVKLVIFLRTV